jgi:hypothetical protein
MKASAGAEACVIERLSSKYEVWSSNPSTAKKKKGRIIFRPLKMRKSVTSRSVLCKNLKEGLQAEGKKSGCEEGMNTRNIKYVAKYKRMFLS